MIKLAKTRDWSHRSNMLRHKLLNNFALHVYSPLMSTMNLQTQRELPYCCKGNDTTIRPRGIVCCLHWRLKANCHDVQVVSIRLMRKTPICLILEGECHVKTIPLFDHVRARFAYTEIEGKLTRRSCDLVSLGENLFHVCSKSLLFSVLFPSIWFLVSSFYSFPFSFYSSFSSSSSSSSPSAIIHSPLKLLHERVLLPGLVETGKGTVFLT